MQMTESKSVKLAFDCVGGDFERAVINGGRGYVYGFV